MPEISVIVPVYNAEKYIEKLVNSVIEQTFKSFELILVNDASTDNSLNIINKLASMESRIKVINKIVNEGPGVARNLALEYANGKYIVFLDSDDWIEQNMFESLYLTAENKKSDVVVCGYYQDFLRLNGTLDYSIIIIPQNVESDSIAYKIVNLDKDKSFSFCWNKLYKRELIEKSGTQFSRIMHSEDYFFNIEVFKYVKSIFVIKKPLYHYIKPKHETLTTVNYIDNYFNLINKRFSVMKNLCIMLNGYDELTRGIVADVHIKHIVSAIENIISSPFSRKNKKYNVREILKNNNTQEAVKFCASSSRQAKIMNFVLKTNNVVFIYIFGNLVWFIKNKMSFIFNKLK